MMATADIIPTADSWINSNAATTNYGTSAQLDVGYESGFTYRAIVQWDLAQIRGCVITDVDLSWEVFAQNGSGLPKPAFWHRVDEFTAAYWFTEAEVTWNKLDSSNSWGTAGGDYGAADVAATLQSAAPTTVDLGGFETVVQAGLDSYNSKLCLIYVPVVNPATRVNNIRSSDYVGGDIVPTLQVSFTPRKRVIINACWSATLISFMGLPLMGMSAPEFRWAKDRRSGLYLRQLVARHLPRLLAA